MAVQVKLARREDTASPASDISSISLLSNTDGFDLEYYDGWTQAVAQGMTPGNLTETFNLVATGDDHDDLALHIQGLDDKLKETAWYWDDPTERYGVWLRAQLTNETNARQALIRRAEGQPGESFYGPYVDVESTCRRYALAMERLPWWEDTSTTEYTDPGISVTFNGDIEAVGTIAGDVPSRIAYMELSQTNGNVEEFWLGFRTNRFGARNNFAPRWDCEDGTVLIADTTAGATYMTTTFATDATMASRFYVKVSDASAANYNDQRGQFLVLLRAQLSAGATTVRVRLMDGYTTIASELRRQDRVTIESTDWRLYPLGTVQIPPLPGLTTQDMLRSYRLLLQAERTTGAGSLRCDKFVLIPISEGAIYASNVTMTSAFYVSRIRTVPQKEISGWTYSDVDATTVVASVAPRPQGPYGFTMPAGGTSVVFAAQGTGAHVEASGVLLRFYTLQRWRTLRGTDT